MDKFEEIKNIRTGTILPYMHIDLASMDWLISEHERLEKEKEWLIWKVIGDERYGLFTSGEKEKAKLILDMQQALREGK